MRYAILRRTTMSTSARRTGNEGWKSPLKRVIIDTGPLVAYYNDRDDEHARCKEWFHANPDIWVLPITIAEVCGMLRKMSRDARSRLRASLFLSTLLPGLI